VTTYSLSRLYSSFAFTALFRKPTRGVLTLSYRFSIPK